MPFVTNTYSTGAAPKWPGVENRKEMKKAGLFLLLSKFALSGYAQGTQENSANEFRKIADEYFDTVYFRYQPTAGTALGLHQYDAQLEDASRAELDRQLADLHRFETRLGGLQLAGADLATQSDREMLVNSIRSTLLSLETLQSWKKNPDLYSSGLAASAFTLISRKFAPPEQRLRSLISREQKMPQVLKEARANLDSPPPVYLDIALRQLDGNINFFRNDVPAAFKDVHDAALRREFETVNSSVISALQDYGRWLRTDLQPRAKGDFRIGADAYRAKLRYDEMVDTPLDRLLEIGRADLKKNQDAFNALAKELDPSKTPREVLQELGQDHPKPDQLLDTFRATFDGLIAFIKAKHIIEIPSQVRPILEETPPFMRATTFASMDTPGPFEKVAKEAYFNVTLPEKSWTPQRVEGYMHSFNYGTIIATAIHEAYPGHYVQLLYSPQAPGRIRKIIGASSNVEGWAHYCEQMMIDEGYAETAAAGNHRRALLIRLGQLQDALLRDARYIVGIQMHTGQMTMEQAREFFVQEGYQSEESARVETDRGTADPTYLYYTLGKLEIMKLRDDMQKKLGPSFSLEHFHSEFVRQGYPPIPVIRRAMLGETGTGL
jgi:uncharacterized protein (DUF885 family)